MTTVVIVDAAEEQLGEIVKWWAVHREASPLLVMQEFDRCVSLLEVSPDVAAHNHFVLDRGGKVFKQAAQIINLPASATEDDHLALLAYLNSSTACFGMKQVGQAKASHTEERLEKERFISYPGCESDRDGEPVYGWAGWNHLQRAQALAALYLKRKTEEAWTADRLTPMLAGLLELLPWIQQLHNELDPEYGLRMGDYFAQFLDGELATLSLTTAQLEAWRPQKANARHAKEEATALADRPAVEFVAEFRAFNAIRLLVAVNGEAA